MRSLVVVDIAPKDYGDLDRFVHYIEAMRALPLDELVGRADAEERFAAVEPDAGVRGFLLQNLRRNGTTWSWQANLDLFARDAARGTDSQIADFPRHRRRTLRRPGRLARRRRLQLRQGRRHRADARPVPAGRPVVVKGVGHWVHSEAPEVVTETLRRVLRLLTAGRALSVGAAPPRRLRPRRGLAGHALHPRPRRRLTRVTVRRATRVGPWLRCCTSPVPSSSAPTTCARRRGWSGSHHVCRARPATTTSPPCRAGCCPGLVDAHSHIGLGAHGAVDDATAEQQALADRDAGALLLRDAGSPADTRWVQARDDLPRLVRAGRHIARTRRYIRNFAWEVEPEQLVEQVRLEARAGDGWVKLVGDWIDRDTGDLSPCWPADVLAEAVAAAHEEGARVTAHCFGEESLRDLAAAGTDCVEHACGLEPDTIASFAAQGHRHRADPGQHRAPSRRSPSRPARSSPTYYEHMIDLHERRYATIADARDAGIPVYVGTDAGGSLPHGLVATEVAHLAHAGFTTTEALSAACWGARTWLGWPGLEEGEEADLVVYADDPREDLAALAGPSLVVLRGRPVA